MSLNFVVVEGVTNTLDLDEIYEDFKKDYLNPNYTADQVRRKHNLEPRDYKTLNNRVREETGLKKKPTLMNSFADGTTNIYKLKNCYGIRKYIDGELTYFGYYPDMDTAMMVRDKLYEAQWDKSVGDKLYEEYGVDKGNYHHEDISKLLPEFKHLYADVPTHVEDIYKKLRIGGGTYTLLLRMLREKYPNIKKYRFPRSRESYDVSSRPNRYLHKDGDGRWSVVKCDRSYGRFDRLEDAVRCRNKLEVNGWQ